MGGRYYCSAGGGTIRQKQVLDSWEKENPDNPELFRAYFNYYLKQWRQERIRICADTSSGAFYVRNSTGQIVGSYNKEVTYNHNTLSEALARIDAGIKLYPDRLDMGLLMQTQNYYREPRHTV